MVPVPDSRTLMAIPITTISQITEPPIDTLKDEQQARDLLVWNEGVGTLPGCDLRFKINQLGCLELLDSDDESENITTVSKTPTPTTTTNRFQQKKAKIRQISPGSSLLRDGPRPRPKSLLRKLDNSILLEKLVPKHKLDEIKTNVGQWTIEDVKNFIDSIPGCTGYGELFESQQICGKSLIYLDQRDLLDVIKVKLGPAVKIYHAISVLK